MNNKEKLLFISFDMLPNATNFGSVQRIHYLCNYLVEDFDVISMSSLKGKALNVPYDYLSIQSSDYSKPIRALSKRIYSQNIIHLNESASIDIPKKLLKSFRSALKYIAIKSEKIVFNEPNHYMGILSHNWSKKNSNNIINLINKENIKVTILSGPPFGIFSLTKKIKRKTSTKIILDYRDPWNLWNKGSIISNFLERKYLKRLDRIVFTNDSLSKDMIRRFKLQDNQVSIISNGISPDYEKLIISPTRLENKVIISHIGDISLTAKKSFRDITNFIESLKNLPIDALNSLIVYIVGVNDCNRVKDYIPNSLRDVIKIIPPVDPMKSYTYMQNSDILLLLHTDESRSAQYLISAKLYDYIYSGRFILSIGSSQSQHKLLVEDLGIGIHVENSCEQIKSALVKILSEKMYENFRKVGKEEMMRFSRSYQNSLYKDVIKKLMGE